MEIIWSIQARDDLKNIYNYSRTGTEKIVKKYILNLIEYTNSLSQNPFLGRVLFTHNNLEYHLLIYRKHKIIYTITNHINIVSVIHSSRNLEQVLSQIKFL